MAKKAKKQKRRPNISPLSVLRPRLDALFAQTGWAEQEAALITADLTTVIAGIEAEQYLPILVKAVNDAPEPVQLTLDKVLPNWLRDYGLVDSFTELVQRDRFDGQDYEVAVAWLSDVGVEQAALQVERDPAFYRAYFGADGMDSQGFYLLFWYANRRQTRVRGINVLIDFNPPWDGAAKDIVILPNRSPQEMIREFVDMWKSDPGITIEALDAVEAKKRFFEVLIDTRENDIRLHKDFVEARDLLIDHLFPLPNDEETPILTIEDFDELCESGQSTEKIRTFEQRVGRWVRSEDGKKILVGAENFLDEDDLFDQIESR